MRKHIVPALIALMLCLPLALQAKVKHLLPLPQEITATEDVAAFTLSGNVTINYLNGAKQCALLEEFFTTNGCTIGQSGKQVNVSLVASIEGAHDYALHGYENEAYTLKITSEAINITAVTATGVIRAAQTLTQLAEGWDGTPALEELTMKDWPAFKLRGYMHDVGRSFISIEELIKQIKLFSRFKVNTFHWHLTENQAWRFEIKAYPQLTESENMSRFPGEFYTQQDAKNLLAVAKKHGVIVIPEIDMPGHSEAFTEAMGFGMQTEEGKVALKKILDEVAEVFAGVPYIHIGGDEVSTTAAYLNEMIAYAESKGTDIKGGLWNPINGIGQDALNHSLAQMWGTRGYLASGKANIDCRYNYTNHFDVFADLVGIYKSTIYYSQKGSADVAGAISGCWNDRKVADEVAIMAQNNVWANVIATAERAWIGGGKQYIDNATNTPDDYKKNPYGGGVMLPNSGDEYEEFKSWEERFLFHKAHSLMGEPIPYVKQTNVRWRITDAFPNGGSETAAFGPEEAGMTASTDLLPETFVHDGQTYYTGMATGAGIYLAHTWGNSIINAYYSNPQFNHTAYAWTYVYSDKEQKVGAQIEFQNYSRSEQDGAAPAGKWDHFGSKIWINGEEIAAPTWDNTGVSVSSKEVELKNENFPGRKPIEVTLKQGWNKVFIKLPYFNKGYRLKKWMFTCVFTDTEGVNAVEGLIYSPNQCMDEATELVAAKVSEIKHDRGNLIGTAVGLWPESAAAALDAKVKEIEATYVEEKTAEERAAQVAALEEAWSTFAASLTNDNMNLPISGNYYRMYTPLRGNRYATGNGADAAITGPTEATTKASIWKFVKRTDNAFDIINLADGTYISPASNNNTALKTVTAQPSAGWTIKKAENVGNVIVVSGSAQFNQQKDGNLHLLNWGSGTNTTDDGCEYRFVDVTSIAAATPIKLLASYEEFVNGNIYTFETARGWMGAKDGSNNVISTAKTSHGLTGSADNAMFQWTVYKSEKGKYYLYNLGKKQFMGVQSTNNASVPFAQQPTGNALTFKDNGQNNGYPIMFSTDNAGVVNHSTSYGDGLITWTGGWSTLNDGGSNHKVALISALPEATLQDIAAIVADYEFEDQTISSYTDFENGGVYTFETARGKMGATEENAKIISTARTTVTNTKTSFFMWTVYKSGNGNYYLYNLGKKQFMGVQSANNTEIDFVATPAGKKLTFKQSSSADYPIMFSTDNAAVVNHSTNHGGGLISWTGGWNTLNDGGSNHKVTLVSRLPEATLQEIAALVENYDRSLPIKVEVDGWTENNPNTHFGSVTATTGSNVSSTKLLTNHMAGGKMAYSNIGDVVAFTREYRGFEFQGFKVGEQSLGKSFTLTEAIRTSITEETPLVAMFTTTDDVTLFYDDDPFSYRIPAIATTSTGRLIAVSDYRYSLDDIGRYNFGTANPGIDLVIRMSDDNGKTWGATKTIAKGSCVRGTNDCAYGDAAIAVVGQKVLVMGAAGDVMFGNGSATSHNRTVRIFSEDGGENWTAPLDISETFFINADATINSGYSLFFGSGMLAVDENYNNTGNARIYGAVLVKKEGTGNAIYVVYTDDFGLTWSVLGGSQTHIANNDEPKVEILPSGQILLSIRRQGGGGRQFNVFTYSDKATNAGSWNSNVNGCNNGGSNSCNGEIFLVDAKKADGTAVKLLMQSQPKGGSGLYDRRDVTIWYKEVDNTAYTSAQIAENWAQGLQVSTQQSAYSTMSLQEDGKIAFFFEEAPCYGDDQGKGYCMAYVPLTIDQITKGNYFSPDADLNTVRDINVELTDAQGNIYRDQVQSLVTGVAAALTTKYPFITLGDNAALESDGTTYTYTNSVTLPFKVSKGEEVVWHNIYWPANTGSGYPVYLSASSANDTYVPKVTESVVYGNSSYNTSANADKISWAVYSAGYGFTFKFKNRLTGKFIQATGVAGGNAQNVKFVDEAEATTFELVPDAASYMGDYALKASVNSTVGYLCSTSATGYHYATHYSGSGHQGAWVKFAEVPDFETLIAEVNTVLTQIGTSLGQYKVTDANAATTEAAKTAMVNSSTVKLNDLNTYKNLLEGAALNMPVEGQYFRVAYDYGGSVGKLYMQGVASTVKGVAFTGETDEASIWQYRDGTLYSYYAEKNLREHGNDRGLHDTKTTVEFSASPRSKGKYNVKCGSFIHANSSNGNYFTDHCSGDGGHTAHDLILEEYVFPEEDEVTGADALPGDGTLRFYRLAIPVTKSAFENDLESSNDKVYAFWQECEDFVNQMFVPLGFCFDVVVDDKLINVTDLTIGNSGFPEIGNCTYELNDIIGEANYDVAMWVTHRDDVEENSGLSALKGAYSSSTKGSGYAKTDKWVVAHELGHMFGAVHTLQGEGSLMDNMGEYFSYPSIKAIRNSAKGTSSYNNVKVANNAPQFDAAKMQATYRIPQGACLAIEVQATDIDGHKLMYTAIGCNSANVDNVQEGQAMTLPFASFAPQESNIISYAPIYTADAVYDDYFYLKEGTGVHEMEAGTYPLSILVNDVPSTAWSYAALAASPFYSTYAIWETQVQIVEGTAFKAAIASEKKNFTAGEKVTVEWGVNENYFTADSRLRITMSADYGKTFEYVLAESVKALDGQYTVTLPNVNIGQVDVDFATATRAMNGGVIKVEEIGGPAYTLTVLDPNNDKGFTIDATQITSYIGAHEIGTFYANEPMTIPAGVTAYVATTTPVMNGTEGTITMTAIADGIIPAETGAVICGEAGQYLFTKASTEGTAVTGNLLRGYAGTAEYAEVAFPTDGSVNYVLTVQGGKVGFYKKASGFKVYNNKAYLNVPAAQNVRSLTIRFEGDGSTGIENSEFAIQNSEFIYDLMGRRVLNPTKGVYVVGGKKVIIK